MHSESFVVGIGTEQIAGRRQQFQPNEQCSKAADKEKCGDGEQVQQGNAFVVCGEEPRAYAVLGVYVIFPFFAYC